MLDNYNAIKEIYKKENRLVKVSPEYCEILGTDRFEDTNREFGKRFLDYRKEWRENPKHFIVNKFPLHLDVELNNTCNLRCLMCQIPFSKMEKNFMGIDMLKKILDEAAKYNLFSIKFNFRGEPLMHPQITEFIALAKTAGILEVQFNSNGTLLNKKLSQDLIEAGLDRIKFSVDSINPLIYNEFRRGANYRDTVHNISDFVKIRNRLKRKFPSVQVQMVVMKTNLQEMGNYVKFWENRVNRIGFSRYRSQNNLSGIKENFQDKQIKIPCSQLWQRLVVTCDGTILMCCGDYLLRNPLGNININTLSEIWNSDKLNKIRSLHQEGKFEQIPVCRDCEVNYK